VGAVKPRIAQRLLRWYPPAWRHRYGEELMALLEDTYGTGPLPRRCRTSLFRSGMIERARELRKNFRTYTAYSIACAVVWAVILAAVWAEAGETTRRTFALLFGGWVIGWLSATIARVVYPPPKKWEAR
jgi:hypothetical protein